MEYDKFTEYLQQVLALPTAIFEAPTFGFSEAALQQCFKRVKNLKIILSIKFYVLGRKCKS